MMSPPLDSPPSRQCRVPSALPRNFDQPSEKNPSVEMSVATGASRSSPMNGSLTSVPKPVSFAATAFSTCWLCSAREKSVSAGFSLFFRTRE